VYFIHEVVGKYSYLKPLHQREILYLTRGLTTSVALRNFYHMERGKFPTIYRKFRTLCRKYYRYSALGTEKYPSIMRRVGNNPIYLWVDKFYSIEIAEVHGLQYTT